MARDFQATIERADKTFDWVVQHGNGRNRSEDNSVYTVYREGTIIEVSPLRLRSIENGDHR